MNLHKAYDKTFFEAPIIREELNEYSSGDLPPQNLNETLNEEILDQKTKEKDDLNKFDKEKIKKAKWNAYMKKYNQKKKQEREERLNKVLLKIGNSEKLYDVQEINLLIIEYMSILVKIIENNRDKFDIDHLKQMLFLNMNDIYNYSFILQNAVKTIL